MADEANQDLHRADVVGRQLIEVLQSSFIEDDMSWSYVFFRIDSGITFFLPFQDDGHFTAEEPRSDATPQEGPELDPVLGHRIVKVLRDRPEDSSFHDSPYLLMDNGYAISHVMGCPVGLSDAGLYIYAPGKIDTSHMIDFFDDSYSDA